MQVQAITSVCRLVSACLLLVCLCRGSGVHNDFGKVSAACRNRRLWPFSSTSIWNHPIGHNAEFVEAAIFHRITPKNFFSDNDYFFSTNKNDKRYAWYNQGWWGKPGGDAHCKIKGNLVGSVYFPANTTVTEFGNNNAAGILQPDNVTLLQMQPLYHCDKDSPILASDYWLYHNVSILGDGIRGAHGGSGLSAVGGTIRIGELLPDTSKIEHALKLELYANDYYYGGTDAPCFTWPALNCDGYAHSCANAPTLCYNGTNIYLKPGALLAIPPNKAPVLKTEGARKIAFALENYGGYLVDDTADNRGTLCLEKGATEQFQQVYGYPFDARSGDFFDDLLRIFQSLSIVKNNTPNTVGGGGSPVRPLAPPICDID
eukprot:TRINITY_DN21923_c0_g1_i1.p1 TRINITY_DN21923_c0_g1~~TRINITY_DN21923_c0_g1_i1.p1  ORF type:complete len:373 (-),score=42.66 TRINITY_DN21923_c0_g1_i1:4-1122(-)